MNKGNQRHTAKLLSNHDHHDSNGGSIIIGVAEDFKYRDYVLLEHVTFGRASTVMRYVVLVVEEGLFLFCSEGLG